MERTNTFATTSNKEIKDKYINDITALLDRCDDISLIDLIKKLLEKSV